jgi:hypothetical protein
MRLTDALFPLTVALDIVALAAVISFPILALGSLAKTGKRQGSVTAAYLGYLCCAALAASLAAHFTLDGGEIFMMFVFWLVPFALAASVALVLTAIVGSSDALWKLALSTVLLAAAQFVAELLPGGIGGLQAVLLLAVYCLYPVFVAASAARYRAEWWHWSRTEAA